MKYEIKGELTQVIWEAEDQKRKPVQEQDEFPGETIICHPEGGCDRIVWPPKEIKKSK